MTQTITSPDSTGEIKRGAVDETARILTAQATAILADEATHDLADAATETFTVGIIPPAAAEPVKFAPGVGPAAPVAEDPVTERLDTGGYPPVPPPLPPQPQPSDTAVFVDPATERLWTRPAAVYPTVARHQASRPGRHRAPTPRWLIGLVVAGVFLAGVAVGAWLVAMWVPAC